MIDLPTPHLVYSTGKVIMAKTYVDHRTIAYKFINLFSDNRVFPSEWKWMVPLFIVQQPLPVVVNARNFADGIIEGIDKYGVNIPGHLYATYEGSNDWLVDIG